MLDFKYKNLSSHYKGKRNKLCLWCFWRHRSRYSIPSRERTGFPFPPPKFCWNLWLLLDDFIKSSAFRSLTRRRSLLTLMQIMKQKRDQTLTLLESLFFSRKFIQKTILRKEKIYLYPLIKLLQVLLPTLHIYFISNVHSDEHSAQEGISLLDFNYLILILLAQPLTNIVFLAPLGVKFVLLEH